MTRTFSRLPRLDPGLQRLVEAERRRPLPSPDELQRVLSRLRATLALSPGPPDGAGPGCGDAGPGIDGAAAATAGVRPVPGGPHAASTLKLVGGLVGLVVAGVLIALLIDRAGDRSHGSRAAASRTIRGSSRLQANRTAGEQLRVPAASAAAQRRPLAGRGATDAGRRPPPAAVAPADRLAAERRLLDRARAALSGGRSGDGLTALEVHRRRFPDGYLVEEREALAVLALVRAGRHEEARTAAARFRRRYPRSIMLPVVRGAVR